MIGAKPLLALLALLAPLAASAQTKVPGDPYADDPSGIVADPCVDHPKPTDGQGWQMWNLHMLTRDFGQLCRYAKQNAALADSRQPVRVVFMGDSITDNWMNLDPDFWADGRVDRGISGQTTPQMLARFRQDVIALHPRTGNIESMAELARAHGIKVILASTTPAAAFPWSPDKHPTPQIVALNDWMQRYARANGFTYVDYYTALATPEGAMKPGLSSDGVHPTAAGYAVMRPLALAAIAKTLGR
jgi:hypothetical protein